MTHTSKSIPTSIALNLLRILVLKTFVYSLSHKKLETQPASPSFVLNMAKTHFRWNSFRIWENCSLTICSFRWNLPRSRLKSIFPISQNFAREGLRSQFVRIVSLRDDYSIFNEIVRVITSYRSRSDFNFVRLAVEPVFPNFPKID